MYTVYYTIYNVHTSKRYDIPLVTALLGAIHKRRLQDFVYFQPPPLSEGFRIEPTPPPGQLASACIRQNLYCVVSFLRDSAHLISHFLRDSAHLISHFLDE